MVPFSFHFPQYLPPGLLNGMLGGYNDGYGHNGLSYGVPGPIFAGGVNRIDKNDKEEYIVVDDDRLWLIIQFYSCYNSYIIQNHRYKITIIPKTHNPPPITIIFPSSMLIPNLLTTGTTIIRYMPRI